jgi:hypothetical protein
MKKILVTSLAWVAIIAITYGYLITKQIIVIPHQTSYMAMRNNIVVTPSQFEATTLDELFEQVVASRP